jgi:hypothetical protein
VLGHDEGLVVPAHSMGRGYDGPVTELRRWAAHPSVPILAIVLVLVAVACAPAGPSSRSPASAALPASVAPGLTPVPGGSTAAASPSASVSQSDTQTAVGRIWDSLPPSFPGIAGAVPIEPGTGPTSGTFAVGTTLATAMATIRAGLTRLGYNVDVGSPLEDGTVVLDAGGGDDPECRIEVRFTPLSGTITMAVLYGAACPFG